MLKRWGRRGRMDSLAAWGLHSLDLCVPPLCLWDQILWRGLDCDGFTWFVLLPPSCRRPLLSSLLISPLRFLLFLVLPKGDVRVPLYIGGVQQGFQGVSAEQRGAACPRAAPSPVTVMPRRSNRFGLCNGDVGESQLKGVLAWRAPE